jgi:hypothetical protein
VAKKFVLTTVTVKIVSEEDVVNEDFDLSDIDYVINEGEGMGDVKMAFKKIGAKQAAKLCRDFGGDPEFLGLDDKGNEAKEA